MKKITMMLLASVCMLSITACGSQKPSPAEVEQAIEAGNVTVEDALEKGWVTQDWVDSYIEKRTVPAADKVSTNAVAPFTAATISGEEFTREDIAAVTFFAFVDPADEGAEAYYQGLVSAYPGIQENGGDVLVCIKNDENTELFSDAPFPVISYSNALKEAVSHNAEMIEGTANTGSWYLKGAFFSAWFSNIDEEKIVESAKAFAQMQQEMNGEER